MNIFHIGGIFRDLSLIHIFKNAILLLLFAYAKAESMFDDHEDLFESLRNQWGTVLAAALNQYDREVQS